MRFLQAGFKGAARAMGGESPPTAKCKTRISYGIYPEHIKQSPPIERRGLRLKLSFAPGGVR